MIRLLRRRLARSWFRRADAARDARHLAVAIRCYRIGLKIDSGRADIYVQLGNAYKDCGRWTEAEHAYQMAAADSSQTAEAMLRLGHVFLQSGRRGKAIDAFHEVVRLAPDDIHAHYALVAAGADLQALPFPNPDPDRKSRPIPVSGYSALREHWDVPSPDAAETNECIAIVPIAGATSDALRGALQVQSHANCSLSPKNFSFESGLIVFLAEEALPHRHLCAWLTRAARISEADGFVFDGERRNSAGEKALPILRWCSDPISIRSRNQLGRSLAVRPKYLRAIRERFPDADDNLIVHILLISLTEAGRLAHIPLPLVSLTPHADDEGSKTHAAALALLPRENLPSSDPICVIIPTLDNFEDLEAFVESLETLCVNRELLHIMIIDNGRTANPDVVALGASPNRSAIHLPIGFNWSRLNNEAARMRAEPILVFANDDMKMLTPGWDDALRISLADRRVGAVGIKLLYPDDSIQHAGVLVGWQGSTIHDGLYRRADDESFQNRYQIDRCCSAVTGAFLAVTRSHFESAGGFDEIDLTVAHSDIDFCLKLRASGLRTVWLSGISAYHHESKSRGLDHVDPARAQREAAERAVMRKRWGAALDQDPSLNPFWVQEANPLRLIAPPDVENIERFIRLSSKENPWLPNSYSRSQSRTSHQSTI
ncbi:MAG: tetratricopeptide repeat protein [Sphingomonadaceae bacterium]